MDIDFKDRKVIIAIVGVLSLLILSLVFVKLRPGGQPTTTDETQEDALPDIEALPTVDASVSVSLVADALKHEVTLTIGYIPLDTETIEYELSYLADGDLPKGVIGTIDVDGDNEIEREITLGTCSAGTCNYDEGVESVRVILKFNSTDGSSSIFEEEFEI